jgi:long-chain acyl-CoA synthetase
VAELAHWAEVQPDTPAIVSSSGTRTFRELNDHANQLARALQSRGVVAGDAVALLCGNRPEFAEVLAACVKSGLRLTPVNWHLTGGEASYIVADCEAKVLITDEPLSALATEARQEAPKCEIGLVIGGSADGFESFEDALAAESTEGVDESVRGGTMLYTSGTTGRPKGVYRKNVVPPGVVNLYGYNEAGGDVHLCTGPLYHAAPLAFSLSIPLAFGATVILMESWDAAQALKLIEDYRVTHTHMVPTMFHRLLSLPEQARLSADLSSVRHVLHGAAPCPVKVKFRIIDWFGPVVWEYYAATEGVGSFVDSASWLERPGTVGRPAGEGQVVIGDNDGTPLPTGDIGLVYLLSPEATRFQYFNDAEKTKSSFRGEYFTLGDVGYIDDAGFLYLTDRSTNLIISGGVNIYPAEIDAVLLEHPSVADAATIGVPNEEWGEEVIAVVELQPGVTATDELADELVAFCREHLAHFKCPRRVEFMEDLPRQDNGKIYKRLLRDLYRS